MKKILYFAIIAAMGLVACKKDDEETPATGVKNLVITHVIQDNGVTVDFTATAENATSYSWVFGNGETGQGTPVVTTYTQGGDYWVKCTAKGSTDKITDSVKVTIELVVEISDVEALLCGYNEETEESTATWYNLSNVPMAVSGGARSFRYDHVSDTAEPFHSFFDPIDQGWWNGETLMNECLNDAYSFKFNQAMEFDCAYGDDGFVHNWAWAAKDYSMTVDQYGDVALDKLPKTGSWAITEYKHADYPELSGAPKTCVDGDSIESLFVLETKSGTYMTLKAALPEYQILRIDADTIFIRYAVDYPTGFPVDPSWPNPEWISDEEGEWSYSYLVKTESTPVEE